METVIDEDPDALLLRSSRGDVEAWERLVSLVRPRLRRLVAARLDTRLSARFDPSDIIQDALIDASRALPHRQPNPEQSAYLWFRSLTLTRLAKSHRRHLNAAKRDVRRETLKTHPGDCSSILLAKSLDGLADPSPLGSELKDRKEWLNAALFKLTTADREILALRHYEELSPQETATVLGISKAAAGKRYLRALARLKERLSEQL